MESRWSFENSVGIIWNYTSLWIFEMKSKMPGGKRISQKSIFQKRSLKVKKMAPFGLVFGTNFVPSGF